MRVAWFINNYCTFVNYWSFWLQNPDIIRDSPQKSLNILRSHGVINSTYLASTRRTNFAKFSVLFFCDNVKKRYFIVFWRTINKPEIMKNSPQKGLNILRLHKVMSSNLLSTRRTNFAEFSVLSFCYKTNKCHLPRVPTYIKCLFNASRRSLRGVRIGAHATCTTACGSDSTVMAIPKNW